MATPPRDRTASRAPLGGPALLATAAILFLLEVAIALPGADRDAGLREVIRLTARTSVLWFVLAFAARPLVALRPSAASKWLLRHRRHLGLATAISHGGHLLAIAILAGRQGAAFWQTLAPTTIVGGTLGYVLLAAMVATSTDRAAAGLGRRRWRALHLTGMWAMWGIFASTYLGQLGRTLTGAVLAAVLVAAAGLRAAAALRLAARARPVSRRA